MLEGFWLVEFYAGDISFGKGVVVLQNNQVLGGDSAFYCTGEYYIKEGLLSATLDIQRHNEFIPSVFGDIDSYRLEFKQLNVQKIMDQEVMFGNMAGHEDLKVNIQFKKLIKAL